MWRWLAALALLGCNATIIVGDEHDEPLDPSMVAYRDAPTGAFAIDRYEASRVGGEWGSETADADGDTKVADRGLAEAHGFAYDDDGGEDGFVRTTVVAENLPAVLPIGGATFYEAAAACANAGKRLCTSAEWQWACQGGNAYNTYTYGNTFDDADEPGVDCWTNAMVAGSQLTGSAASCHNAEGVFDLSGNVDEWTSRNDANSADIRGGAANTDNLDLVDCTHGLDRPIGTAAAKAGFRCCLSLP